MAKTVRKRLTFIFVIFPMRTLHLCGKYRSARGYDSIVLYNADEITYLKRCGVCSNIYDACFLLTLKIVWCVRRSDLDMALTSRIDL